MLKLMPQLSASELSGMEDRLLGSVLSGCDPDRVLAELDPGDFTTSGRRDLFIHLRERHSIGLPPDLVSVGEGLIQSGDPRDILNRVGGLEGLASMACIDAARLKDETVSQYVLTLKRVSCMVQTRKIMAGLDQAIGAGDLEQEEKFRELLQRNLDQADLLSGGRRGSSDPSLLESFEVWRRARVLIVEDMLGRSLPGLSFGIPSLDEVLSPGLRPGRFMVIGAGTGEGKTILALMMALKTAREGLGVLYLSWEMPGEELLERAAAMETEVPAWRIQKRRLRTTGEDHAALEDWRPPGGLLVPLVSGLKASRIPRLVKRARAKLAVMGLPLALVVLDHLQLIRGGEKAETRALELKDVANLAKEIAMSGCGGHPLAVLGLSQLRRAREAGNPVLGDLKESGGLEEAADTVLLLVRGRDQRRRMTCEARLSVGKNRGGPVGHEVSMTFEEDRLVFE